MGETLVCVLLVWVAAVLFFLAIRRFDGVERPWLWAGFAFHAAAAIGQVIVTKYYYGGGDIMGYYFRGRLLSDLLRSDLVEYLPSVLLIAGKQAPILPLPIFGMGTSTGAMAGYAGISLLLTNDSLYGACMLFAFCALAGQLAIYSTMREFLPAAYRRRALIAVFMIPSVVFWSSGIMKEAVAIAGLGLAFRGFYKVLVARPRKLVYLIPAIFGLLLIYTTKAYALLPLTLAIGAWAYLSRVDPESKIVSMMRRPFFTSAVVLAVVIGVVAFGRVFPEYSPADFEQETSKLQGLYYGQASAGSTFRFEASDPTADRQIYLAPLGFLSAMFRPLPFEVHNVTSALEAGVMLVFNLLFLRLVLFRSNRRYALSTLKRSPVLLALLVFIVVFGTGVGLATPNLGSLSRYRILMMPFYGLLLACLIPLRTKRAR